MNKTTKHRFNSFKIIYNIYLGERGSDSVGSTAVGFLDWADTLDITV